MLIYLLAQEDEVEAEKFESQFRATVFAADPGLYDSIFETTSREDMEYVIPQSHEEVEEIMDQIRDQLAAVS